MFSELCQLLKRLGLVFECKEPLDGDGFSDQHPSFTEALRSVTTVWLQESGFLTS